MSVAKPASASPRVTPPDLRARKGGTPIVSLTAYTAPIAALLAPHCDFLLVGDSVGMVLHGMDNTLGVTLDMMILHAKAVKRGAPEACVLVDMPFGTYEESPEQAFRNCARVMAETGAAGVKLEGGVSMAPTIAFLAKRAIPVMGHVGLLPQSVNVTGGFRAHGREAAEAKRILADAKAVAEAGAFAMVVEGVVEPLARQITKTVPVPTIGIGASPHCDGQILVSDDLIGLFATFKPRFVKRYANLAAEVSKAAAAYAAEVKARTFPAPEHCFGVKKKGG
ncbi:MAG: 3-methyl-2-oxobutanoate hydroxymethyltransferase [Rhodospirillales bacterium]|nr:3-methyl-2-oxobutanoate hydroxymethyltransferase [Rhodospirillales bacterium]